VRTVTLEAAGAAFDAAVAAAVETLSQGNPVALPTETVYGLAADALNPVACAKIFEAKERPLADPLIVHVPDVSWLERIAGTTPLSRRLAEHFWPGPLTLVLPGTELVPDLVTAGQDTVAVRMSAHPVFRAVVQAFGSPLAAPSANRFGRISPTSAEHVRAELEGRIPLILDGSRCAHGIESTIVRVIGDELEILRHGPITADDLAEFAPVRGGGAADVVTPGSLKSHYAPRTPLDIVESLPAGDRAPLGLLSWKALGEAGFGAVEILSHAGDLREVAANLYGAMRRLDESGVKRIVALPVPEEGIGVAIMERLRKAATRD